MKEGLLFDWVDIHRDYLAIDKAVENAIPVFTYSTDASLAIFDRAVMIAEKAPDFLFIELFIKHCLFHNPIIALPYGIIVFGGLSYPIFEEICTLYAPRRFSYLVSFCIGERSLTS